MAADESARSKLAIPGLNRPVLIFAVCQALAQSGTVALIVVAALSGQMLAEDKSLATLPISLMFTATMLTTIPASMLMNRVGRRIGFSLGAVIGVCAAAVSCAGLLTGSFAVFAAGAALQGMYNAFWQYYRFAAADAVGGMFKSRAISYVLVGGVVAAIVGPELAEASAGMFERSLYAGVYAGIGVLAVAAFLLLQAVDTPRPGEAERADTGRPLSEIVHNPTFLVAVLSAMVAYGAMVFVMTATPLAMKAHAQSFADTAFVIRWHVLAMFVPSFFTGHLIYKLGVVRVILAGTLIMLAAVAVNLSGTGVLQFWTGLFLIGLGWNFMFIGGTTLLTETFEPSEKAKVQGINDFLVFGSAAAATFASGGLLHLFGWQVVNYGVIAPIVLALAAALWLHARRRAPGAG
ncbi:MAG: MFS transporter [Alphaproteobacteria bacterium]